MSILLIKLIVIKSLEKSSNVPAQDLPLSSIPNKGHTLNKQEKFANNYLQVSFTLP